METKTDAELIADAEKLLAALPSLPYAHDDHVVAPGDSPGVLHVFSLGDWNDGPPFLTVMEYCKDEAIALTSCVPVMEELAKRLREVNERLLSAHDAKSALTLMNVELLRKLEAAELRNSTLEDIITQNGYLR